MDRIPVVTRDPLLDAYATDIDTWRIQYLSNFRLVTKIGVLDPESTWT